MTKPERPGPGENPPGPTESHPDSSTDESLEGFLARLHQDGVEAGRQEADRLRREGEEAAAAEIERAEAEAARIVADAEAEAERLRERGRAELELAARDVVVRLRATLRAALTTLLREAAGEPLRDPAFLGTLIRDLLSAYTTADTDQDAASASPSLEVRVPAEMADALLTRGLGELGQALVADPGLDVGFEYTTGNGTVEVSPDAVVDALMALVTPRLREVLAEGRGADGSSDDSELAAAAGTWQRDDQPR